MTTIYRDCDTDQVIEQLGMMNIMAVSGGRVARRKTGVTLPVGRGYSVEIDLQGNDTYVVKRVFTRAGKVTIKGECVDVYAFDLGDVAYYASCYVNVPFGQNILPEYVYKRDLVADHCDTLAADAEMGNH